MLRGAAASWEPVGSLHIPGQAGTAVPSPPSHLQRVLQEARSEVHHLQNQGLSPSHGASEPPDPPAKVCSLLSEASQRCCVHSLLRECCRAIKSFCLSHRTRLLSSTGCQGGYYTWVLVHKSIPMCTMGAGMCRRAERGKQPRQSSANSTDKIVPPIPKAGLGLSDLAPKTAPAYIPQAGAAALILRNQVLCIALPFRFEEGARCSP